MNILILGGTQFLGRYIVESAKKRGHNLTLFNRGKSNPNLFPSVKLIEGDQTKDILKLGEGKWDVVIDTCGYVPIDVEISASALRKNATS